jgi:hypothetical protein
LRGGRRQGKRLLWVGLFLTFQGVTVLALDCGRPAAVNDTVETVALGRVIVPDRAVERSAPTGSTVLTANPWIIRRWNAGA